MRALTISILTAAALIASTTPAGADEMKAPITAMSIMNLLARPIESRSAAFDRSLRESGPAPARTAAAELLDDGSVRYGRTTVTVKNPCPPGPEHYEPSPLPGRRAR